MVQIVGTYKVEKNENLVVYLQALGASEELAQKANTPGITVDISLNGNVYSFISSTGLNTTFTLNEPFEESLPMASATLKSVAKMEGKSTIVITSETADGRSGTRKYEFSDTGFTVTMTFKDVVAKRFFIRV